MPVGDSRSLNVKRNMISGTLNKAFALVLPFIIRTILIQELGAEYLGLSSLFTSILQVLNMAELGFSNAIVFSLYKPIAEAKTDEICALMAFYRKVYKIVGIVILIVGLCLLPFLPYLVKGSYPSDINLYILYLIYLTNTTISYFAFAYKSVLLTASQRQDIITNIDSVLNIFRYSIQIIVLLLWKNYYIYIVWNLIFTFINNIWVATITAKRYPEYICKGKLNRKKRKNISQQIKGLAIGKVSQITRNSFDSIVLSAFCGLIDVTIYSNYYYIFNAVSGFLSVIISSMSAGVGNSVATASIEKNHHDQIRFYYIYSWIVSFCTVSFFGLYQHFMRLWAGEKLTASNLIMAMFCIYFYISQMGQVRSMYANAAGIWWEFRTLEIAEMISNLVLNLGLGYLWGMAGILLSTIITVFVFSVVGITHVTYKEYFKKSSWDYWKDSFYYITITTFSAIVTQKICLLIKIDAWAGIIVKLIVCFMIPNILFFMINMVSKRHREYLISIKNNVLCGIIKNT